MEFIVYSCHHPTNKTKQLVLLDATDGEVHEQAGPGLGQDGDEVCDQGQAEEHDHGEAEDVSESIFDEDPRENKQKYGVVSLEYKLSFQI